MTASDNERLLEERKEARRRYEAKVLAEPSTREQQGGSVTALYFYNPKTGHITYTTGGSPGGGWQLLGTTQPAGYVGGQARGVATDVDKRLEAVTGGSRPQQLETSGAYTYDAGQGRMVQERVETIQESGWKPLTIREAKYLTETYISKGMSPLILDDKQLTVEEARDYYAPRSSGYTTPEEFSEYRRSIGIKERTEPTIPVEFLGQMRPDVRGTMGTEVLIPFELRPTGLSYDVSPTEVTAYQKWIYGVGQKLESFTIPNLNPESTRKIKTAGTGVLLAIGSEKQVQENVIVPFMSAAALTTATFIAPQLTIPVAVGSLGITAWKAPEMVRDYGKAQAMGQGSEYLGTIAVQTASISAGAYSMRMLTQAATYISEYRHGPQTHYPGDYIWNARYTTTVRLQEYESTLLDSRFLSESFKGDVLTHAYVRQQAMGGFPSILSLSPEQQRSLRIAEGNVLGRQARQIDFFNLADTSQKIAIDALEGYSSPNDLSPYYSYSSDISTTAFLPSGGSHFVRYATRPADSSQLLPRSFRYDTAGAGRSNINLDIDYYTGTVMASKEYQTLLKIPSGSSPYATRYTSRPLPPLRSELPILPLSFSDPKNTIMSVRITGVEVFAGYPPSQYITTSEISPIGQTMLNVAPIQRVKTEIVKFIDDPWLTSEYPAGTPSPLKSGVYPIVESKVLFGADAVRPNPFDVPKAAEPSVRSVDLYDFIDGGRPNRFQVWFDRIEIPFERAPPKTTPLWSRENMPVLLSSSSTEPLLLEYNPPSFFQRIKTGLDKIEDPLFSPSQKRIYFEPIPGTSVLIEQGERIFTGMGLSPTPGIKVTPPGPTITGGGSRTGWPVLPPIIGPDIFSDVFVDIFKGEKNKGGTKVFSGQDEGVIVDGKLRGREEVGEIYEPVYIFRPDVDVIVKPRVGVDVAQEQKQEQEQKRVVVPIIDVSLDIPPLYPRIPSPTIPPPPIEPEIPPPLIKSPPLGLRRATTLRIISPHVSPAKGLGFSVSPFAGLYSVTLSQFAFGKATYPSLSLTSKKKFKRRVMAGAPDFPTVELEKRFKIGNIGGKKWAF